MPYKGLHSSRAPRFRRSAKTFRRPAQGCGESNAPEQQNDGLQPSGTAVQSPTLGTDLDSRPPVPSTSGTPSAGSSVDPCHEAVDDADSDSESEGEQMKLHVPPSAQETSFPLAAAQDPFMSLAFASSDEYFSNTLGQLPSLSRTYRDSKQPWMVITDKPQGPLLDDGDKNWMWKQYDELSTSGTVSPTLGTVELAQEMVEATSDTIKPEMVECKSEMVDDTLEIVEPTVEPMSETIETEMGKPESDMFHDTSEKIEPMSEPLETFESTVGPMSENIEPGMVERKSEMAEHTQEIINLTIESMSETIEQEMFDDTSEIVEPTVEPMLETIEPEMAMSESEMFGDTSEIVEPMSEPLETCESTVEPMSETIETEMGKPESEMFDDTSEIVEPTVEPMPETIEPEMAMTESEMFDDTSEIIEPTVEPMSEPLETLESTVEPMSENIEPGMVERKSEMAEHTQEIIDLTVESMSETIEQEMFDDTSEIVEPTVEPMSENIEPGMVECKSEMVEHTPEIVDHTVEPMAEIAEPKLEMFEAKLETVEPTQGTVQSTLRTVSSASCLVESKFDSTYIPPPWTGFSELGTDLLTSGTVPPPPWLTVNELCDDVISVHGSDSETDTTGKLPLKELMELDDPLQVPEPSQSMVTTRSKSAVRKCKTSSTRTVCEDVISVHGSDSETDTTGKLPLKELMELDDPPQVPEPSQSMVTTRSKSAVRKCKTSSTRTVCDDVISVHGSDSETDTTGKLPLKELMELDDPPQVPEPSQSMVTTRSKSVAAVPSKTTRKFKTSSTRTANQPAGPIQLSEAGRVRRLPPPSAKQRFQAKLARERSLCRSPPLPRRRRIEVVLPLPPPSDEEESEAEDEGQSKP
ncbi:protein clarinet-like isoform X2 [Anopheles merus]|uniref:protein clarinet-like isoform X2 n=1 Tax=Anopheles merus TaxID=30066 RepID=UPI001BE3FC03|nr:protein clarinet-like isoform X2 [Anopheles merus]